MNTHPTTRAALALVLPPPLEAVRRSLRMYRVTRIAPCGAQKVTHVTTTSSMDALDCVMAAHPDCHTFMAALAVPFSNYGSQA